MKTLILTALITPFLSGCLFLVPLPRMGNNHPPPPKATTDQPAGQQ